MQNSTPSQEAIGEINKALAIQKAHPEFMRTLVNMSLLPNLPQAPATPSSDIVNFLFLDTETSGTNIQTDHMIEVAGQLHPVNIRTGIIYAAIDAFSELQELPGGASVPEAATKVNGLTAVDLDGKTFDLKRIQEVFGRTDLVVPHNAKFDRQFCEKSLSFLRGSQDKFAPAWACTLQDIDWNEVLAAPSSSLPVLCMFLPQTPFFYKAHRALVDCVALVNLISLATEQTGVQLATQLYLNSKKTETEIFAIGAAFEAKDALSARRFKWNDGTGPHGVKAWSKVIDRTTNEGANDIRWLYENIYKSQAERVLIAVVTTKGDRFCLHSEQSPKFELHRFKLGSLVKSLDKVTDTQSTATVPTRLQSPPIPQEERSADFPNTEDDTPPPSTAAPARYRF